MSDVHVTDQSFEEEVVKSQIPVLVDFWAEWCGPCRMQDPILEELGKTYEGKIKIVKVNVDNNPSTASNYAIMSIPTLLIFKNGQIIKQFIGVQSKEKLIEEFNRALS